MSGYKTIEGLDQVYVINVKSFEERQRHVSAELERFHIRPEFVHEWDIPDLSEESERWFAPGCALTLAQKSCCMKHITALERIVARSQHSALVLEDDVILAPDFAQGINIALGERSSYAPLHVVFLGSGGNFFTPRSQRRSGQHLYPASKGRFADSYMIGVDAACARLDWIGKHRLTKPIDNQFDVVDKDLGITLLWFEDPVVEQGSKNGMFQSQIESDPPPWLKGIVFGWEKLRRKYLYQLWR